MPYRAVIDLGTNTFHLLIVEPLHGPIPFREIFRESRFVKLAEEGIERIGDIPFARALETVRYFTEKLSEYAVQDVAAFGTAALRTAENGPEFMSRVRELTGIRIRTISGDQEAGLIARGVQLALGRITERALIMDIGGGSVEFILIEDNQPVWARSFPVGVAVLYRQFHRHEPLLASDSLAIRSFLDYQLQTLRAILSEKPVAHLVGAAGTFDVLANILPAGRLNAHACRIDLSGFEALFSRLLSATQSERHAMDDIPEDRADLIVVALVLVDYVVREFGIRQLTVSNYSMKEGMLVG
ncbi:MAG TPA: hypothetical protein PKE06_07270 [Flavilitoribacter sp.]|nr:hypothetical protein [Flavilitoribacter sp.]